MVAYYDNKPSKFEDVKNGSRLYRYNIEQIDAPSSQEGESPRKQWRCDEVVVWGEMTKKKVVSAVIEATWEPSYEQKLVNEFNSVTLGVVTGDAAAAKTAAYKNFLEARKALKASVEADCDEAGIK